MSATSTTKLCPINWTDFHSASATDSQKKLIPQLDAVITAFNNLKISQRYQIVGKVAASQGEAYLEIDGGLPRPLVVTDTDAFIIFKKKKLGDTLVVKGEEAGQFKKLYYAYSLKKGKTRVYYSIKGVEKALNELAIAKATKSGPAIYGFSTKVSKNRKCQCAKVGAVGKLFQSNLAKAIKDGRIDISTVEARLSVLKQMASEVANFHSNNYIHRDVKFDNFLVNQRKTGEFTIKVADFGFSIPRMIKTKFFRGSLLNTPPESFPYDLLLNGTHYPMTLFTEKNDSWALGMSWVEICYAFNDYPIFQAKEDKFHAFVDEFMNADSHPTREKLSYFMKELDTQKTKDWLTKPDEQNVFEYIIWNLLRLDPTLRWSPQDVVNYLTPKSD